MVFLSAEHLRGDTAPDDAPSMWEVESEQFQDQWRRNNDVDIDGDGLKDLFRTISTTADNASSRPSVFLGPFDSDRFTDEADATFEEDDPDGSDEATAVCTSPSGGALLVLWRHAGGLGDPSYVNRHHIYAWEGAGSYAPGDAQITLLDEEDETAAALTCGGDVDGDGIEELAMEVEGDGYVTHASETFFAMVELPDSGTWLSPDLASFFIAHPTTDNAEVAPPLLGTDVDGDGTDDILYTSSYRSIADDHAFERYRTRLLVYHGERPGL